MGTLNKRTDTLSPYAILVDRTTRWGNPFPITPTRNRKQSLAQYKLWLWKKLREDHDFQLQVSRLHHSDLVCWCAPEPCHADILARAAIWAYGQLEIAIDTAIDNYSEGRGYWNNYMC